MALSRYCHCPGGDGEDNDDMRGEEQDMPYADRDALSRNRRISEGERVTSMMAAMANTSTGIPGSRSGRYRGQAMTEFTVRWQHDDEDKEGESHPTPWTTATRELVMRLCSAGCRQRWERVMLTMAVMMNKLTGMSGVRLGRIQGIGDGGDCSAAAATTTTTTTTTTTRADRIPPRGRWQRAS